MQISFVEPLSRAWERMRRTLFEPFELAKWLVLGFSAWLAGLASSGRDAAIWGDASDEAERQNMDISGVGDAMQVMADNLLWLPLILFGVIVIVGIAAAVFWISSRAKFIFLDNVVHDRAQIVEPWKRFRTIGDSLFLWRVGFFAALCGLLLLLAGAVFLPAATLSVSDALRGLSFAGIFFGVLIMMLLGVVSFFVLLFLENFVIPIMYKFDLKAMEAWRYFLPWLKAHGGWFVVYGFLVLVAAFALQMLVAVLCLFTCCIVLLPYVGTVILLPVWVLYRIYSIEFLAQFHPEFDLFLTAQAVPEDAVEIVETEVEVIETEDELEDPSQWPLDDE